MLFYHYGSVFVDQIICISFYIRIDLYDARIRIQVVQYEYFTVLIHGKEGKLPSRFLIFRFYFYRTGTDTLKRSVDKLSR